MSFKLLVHKFRALIAQDPSDLRTLKGLNLLTVGDPTKLMQRPLSKQRVQTYSPPV